MVNQVKNGQKRLTTVKNSQYGQNWFFKKSKTVNNGKKNGQIWSKTVKNGQNWSKTVKSVKNGQKWSTAVKNIFF